MAFIRNPEMDPPDGGSGRGGFGFRRRRAYRPMGAPGVNTGAVGRPPERMDLSRGYDRPGAYGRPTIPNDLIGNAAGPGRPTRPPILDPPAMLRGIFDRQPPQMDPPEFAPPGIGDDLRRAAGDFVKPEPGGLGGPVGDFAASALQGKLGGEMLEKPEFAPGGPPPFPRRRPPVLY